MQPQYLGDVHDYEQQQIELKKNKARIKKDKNVINVIARQSHDYMQNMNKIYHDYREALKEAEAKK